MQQGSGGKGHAARMRCTALVVGVLLAALFLAPVLWGSKRALHATLYSRRAFLSRFTINIRGEPIFASDEAPNVRGKRVKAAIVVLARNEDCGGVLRSMARMEARFNAKFNYPYIFLNNGAFDAGFINRTSAATAAVTKYGEIPAEHWGLPAWISAEQAAAARADMARRGVLYGERESYHHMCRYFSGFVHRHPLLEGLDYYWRMELDVHYYCDLDYDPFVFMQSHNIKYGFVISVLELGNTIPSLWATTQRFAAAHADLIPADNLLRFMTDARGDYNLCHFWSNFEIGDLDFFRSAAYSRYFEWLDASGGFFLERWGDAPVHSLGAALFLNATQVHFFQDIGYRHNSMKHCPAVRRNRCDCDAMEAIAFHAPSFGVCHARWREVVHAKGERHV